MSWGKEKASELRPKTVTPVYEDGLKLEALIDVEGLKNQFKAFAAEHDGDGSHMDVRNKILNLLRDELGAARGRAEAMLRYEDQRGIMCSQRLSAVQDALIRLIHDFALRHVFRVKNLSSAERIAILAVGGYGRAMLAPKSDIDLLFVLPYKQTALGEQLVEYILYMLWDLGFTVGHATRSVDETLRQAKADITIRTSLVEMRFLHGEEALFDELETRFHSEIASTTASEFIAAKLSERDDRHARMGESRYLVEPNIKEGKGALRDLHTLFWIGKYVYHVKRGRELVSRGVYTQGEHDLFLNAMEFFWTVRCHLHFMTGKPEERLSFDVQPELASRLGYEDHKGLRAVELFMKQYFLIAKDVGNLTRIFCSALEDNDAKESSYAIMDRLRGKRSKPIGKDGVFVIENGRVNVTGPDVFHEPLNALRLFWLVDQKNLDYHPNALRALSRDLSYINSIAREREDMNALFLKILTKGRDPENTLRYMNEAGVLGRFIPDFGTVVAMMQFNMYHSYTVDEHLVRTVGVLSDIESGDIAEDHPLASKILPEITERKLLYFILLLHDIAKGRPEDHSVAGAEVARKICPGFGFSKAQTELGAWLIEEHLTMSTIAQSRDLSDPRTIGDFAKIVQTRERLQLLLLLTVCDIRAVGPNVWNGWKGQLLRTLYHETALHLSGGHSKDRLASRTANAQEKLQEALAQDWPEDKAKKYAELQYPSSLQASTTDELVDYTRLLAHADETGNRLMHNVACHAFEDVTQLTILAQDHPRLLTTVAAGCAAAGANIVDAKIFTTKDGRAINSVFLSREFPDDDAECRRAERIAVLIEEALSGVRALPPMIERRSKRSSRERAFEIEPRVAISNDISDKFTVVELEGLDRIGLLGDVANALSNLNLDIASARVSTFGEKVIDTFYVTDLIGHRIESPQRRGRVRNAVLAVMDKQAQMDDEPVFGAVPSAQPPSPAGLQ
jgi:[protein-PII] uridylyltransferase